MTAPQYHLLCLIISAATVLALATGNDYDATEFIRTSCSATLYPDLCFASLFCYSITVHRNPARLAKIAISLSLKNARHLVSYMSRQVDYESHGPAASAMHDCFTNFGDAVDEIHGSLNQMRRLGGGPASLRFHISNVQTWMSAALTDEYTCTDGFEDVPDGPLKADVSNRVADIKMLTSNALSLVVGIKKSNVGGISLVKGATRSPKGDIERWENLKSFFRS